MEECLHALCVASETGQEEGESPEHAQTGKEGQGNISEHRLNEGKGNKRRGWERAKESLSIWMLSSRI